MLMLCWSFVAALFYLVASKRSNYVQIPLWGSGDKVECLIHEQNVAFYLNPTFTEMMVVDSECGKWNTKCPKYCRDALFSPIHCHPKCQLQLTISLICPEAGRFNSDSSQVVIANWSSQSVVYRYLSGNVLNDTLLLMRWSKRWINDNNKRFATKFVSANMYDIRLREGVFGLKPGTNSAVFEFLNGLKAQRKIISIGRRREVDTVKHQWLRSANFMTFGGLDMYRCADWKLITSGAKGSFALRIPFVDFMGVKFENIMLTFDFDDYFMVIPTPTAELLKDQQILQVHKVNNVYLHYSERYKYDCQANRKVRFLNENHELIFELDHESLILPAERNECGSMITMDQTNPFTYPRDVNEETWRVGRLLLVMNCLAFDYSTEMFGFGKWRRLAPHPHLMNVPYSQ